MVRAMLAYNPRAGRFPPAAVARQAAGVLNSLGWEVDVKATQDADHLSRLAEEAVRRSLDALIVAGGDGSIGRTIEGLRGSRTALAILPTGTTNVWGQELCLPKITAGGVAGVEENASLIARAEPRLMDTGTCNGRPFLLWAGIGLDAKVVREAEKGRSHIKKQFVVPEYFMRTLWTAARWPGDLLGIRGSRASGRPVESIRGRFQLAIVSNIRRYAGGLATVSPKALLDDGEMDLWLFKGRGAAVALRHAWNLLRGRHVHNPNIRRLSFQRVRISGQDTVDIHTDGEVMPPSEGIDIEVHPRSLRILLPETAPEGLFLS